MSQILYNSGTNELKNHNFFRKKGNYFNRILKAYGKIETLLFIVLFMVIIILAIIHNFID